MNKYQKFWDNKHFEKSELNKINRSSVFAQTSLKYFPDKANVLELGAGIGHDTHLFINNGHQVVATDFSKPALEYNLKTADIKNKKHLSILQFDLSNRFPFADQSFDVVYAHLVIHYFSRKITQQIFDEIFRVLKPNGIVAILVNSTTDPEYGQGKILEEDYFEIPSAGPKRYFSVESFNKFIGKFETIILDDKGVDPRRAHKTDLIRFIGRK